ncbi:MAG: amino acid deaminase [Acidobacteriaceae bacterium]
MPDLHPQLNAAPSPTQPSGLIPPHQKGLGCMTTALSADQIASLRWNLLHEDLSLPTAVLYADKLNHNIAWMQKFADCYGAVLAPHGKTTMAPKLFSMQLAAGAWGITLATAPQVSAAYQHGVRRILMANQLIGRQNMAMVAALLDDPGFEFFCLVDSAANVEQLGSFFQSSGKQLHVLLEVGMEGGRTGVRNPRQTEDLLQAISHWRQQILLSGVEIYEGVSEDESAIRSLLHRALDLARGLARASLFQRTPFLLSGAGSAWYDLVAETFSAAALEIPAQIVLRPGCYLTHDAGAYAVAQARIQAGNPVARQMPSSLQQALQLWAYVQSIPEPAKAIVGLGKRDASFDSGLPSPALHLSPATGNLQPAPAHWRPTRMMDQHAYLHIDPADRIAVGDMIGFDISHPCLTFDKWRYLPLLDRNYQVIDVIQTLF